jgi:hypothetical protein
MREEPEEACSYVETSQRRDNNIVRDIEMEWRMDDFFFLLIVRWQDRKSDLALILTISFLFFSHKLETCSEYLSFGIFSLNIVIS